MANNVAILHETLRIIKQGEYDLNGKTIQLRLSPELMEESHVLLPEDIEKVCSRDLDKPFIIGGRCFCECLPKDSYAAAVDMARGMIAADATKPVLVLNFANPVNIGGGVYKGARAQEEDLCRRSTLLCSLESHHASRYYKYNRSLKTYMGSDAMIFSPHVEVFRDEQYHLMEEPVTVAVLTCAAPMITNGLGGMGENEYRTMFYNRILAILRCAAYFGYENIVLGAWGCGAFGNDAALVSDLFYQAMKELEWSKHRVEDMFRHVVFAVRSGEPRSYNFKEFYRNFGEGNFYREEIRRGRLGC